MVGENEKAGWAARVCDWEGGCEVVSWEDRAKAYVLKGMSWMGGEIVC